VSFQERISFGKTGPGRYAGALAEDWYQGRGVYGGFVTASIARAIENEIGEPARSLRTLNVGFCAPATAGEAEIEVHIERAGNAVTMVSARMLRGGEVIAIATATLARARRSKRVLSGLPMPAMKPPHEVADGPAGLYVPDFCRHLEFRQALGFGPFSGGSEAHVGGWCRLKEDSRADAPTIAALLDSWSPAILSMTPEWTGAASIDLSIDFHAPFPEVDAHAYYAYEARCSIAADGYADERAVLWTESGAPLASARQLIAVFG
jgi:acyl-CoA thioesterase